ncbi:MAG: hypothetical protein AAGI01_11000 [Myxococcota bacterium]
MKRCFEIGALLLMACACVGCEAAGVRADNRGQQFPAQQRAARAIVPARGLAKLYERALQEQGWVIRADALEVDVAGRLVRLGPMEQSVGAGTLEALPGDGVLELSLVLEDASAPRLFVPLRLGSADSARICRVQAQASRVEVRGRVELDAEGQGRLESPEPAQVELDNAAVFPVGNCAALEEDEALATALDEEVVRYMEAAMRQAAQELLEREVVSELGLVLGNQELTRISNFDNRRGQVRITGEVNSSGAALRAGGLELALEYTLLAQPAAACAPRQDPTAPAQASDAPVDPAALEEARVDLALVVSEPLVERIAQMMTLGGFACRGLESLGAFGASAPSVQTSDLLFERIGVDDVLFGQRAFTLLSPGALPTVEMRPDFASMQVRWPELTVEVYAEVHGALTRAASVTADVRMTLPLRVGERGIEWSIASLDVSQVTLDVPWAQAEPTPEVAAPWATRVIRFALEGVSGPSNALPLPIDPSTPLRLIELLVRDEDIVLSFRFGDDH